MSDNINFNTGERIRELRQKNGLSQEQLSLRTEITTTYLGLIERNKKNPTIKVIEQICNSLNISLADFFSPTKVCSNNTDEISLQIIAHISNRTIAEKQMLLQLIKSALKLRDLTDTPTDNH